MFSSFSFSSSVFFLVVSQYIVYSLRNHGTETNLQKRVCYVNMWPHIFLSFSMDLQCQNYTKCWPDLLFHKKNFALQNNFFQKHDQRIGKFHNKFSFIIVYFSVRTMNWNVTNGKSSHCGNFKMGKIKLCHDRYRLHSILFFHSLFISWQTKNESLRPQKKATTKESKYTIILCIIQKFMVNFLMLTPDFAVWFVDCEEKTQNIYD